MSQDNLASAQSLAVPLTQAPNPSRLPSCAHADALHREEQKVWIGLYRDVRDPTLAEEVIQFMYANPDIRHDLPALFLRCRQTMRLRDEARRRQQRIGQLLRWLAVRLVAAPLQAIWRGLLGVRDTLLAGRIDTPLEPVQVHLHALAFGEPVHFEPASGAVPSTVKEPVTPMATSAPATLQ